MTETNRATEEMKLCGPAKVDWLFVFSCAAFNLFRIPRLRERCAEGAAGGLRAASMRRHGGHSSRG
jgi:hypothetical protein